MASTLGAADAASVPVLTERSRQKADRRAAILSAAATLFAERGYAGVTIEDLGTAVGVSGPVTFPNGDVCDFLDIVFRCRHVSGEPRVNDDESLAVGWFPLDGLPDIRPRDRESIERALAPHDAVHYEP